MHGPAVRMLCGSSHDLSLLKPWATVTLSLYIVTAMRRLIQFPDLYELVTRDATGLCLQLMASASQPTG